MKNSIQNLLLLLLCSTTAPLLCMKRPAEFEEERLAKIARIDESDTALGKLLLPEEQVKYKYHSNGQVYGSIKMALKFSHNGTNYQRGAPLVLPKTIIDTMLDTLSQDKEFVLPYLNFKRVLFKPDHNKQDLTELLQIYNTAEVKFEQKLSVDPEVHKSNWEYRNEKEKVKKKLLSADVLTLTKDKKYAHGHNGYNKQYEKLTTPGNSLYRSITKLQRTAGGKLKPVKTPTRTQHTATE